MEEIISKEALYLVTLEFSTENAGGGSMNLQLAVDPVNNSLHGSASGRILEGTQFSPEFTAKGTGCYHATGYGNITKVGMIEGQALVAFGGEVIGSYLAPFSASFGVDNDWNGEGQFVVGENCYQCKVTAVS